MFKKIKVKKNERALLLRNGEYERYLPAGNHWVMDWQGLLAVKCWPVDTPIYDEADQALIDVALLQDGEAINDMLHDFRMGDRMAGFRYVGKNMQEVLPEHARVLIWKGGFHHHVHEMDMRKSLNPELIDGLRQQNPQWVHDYFIELETKTDEVGLRFEDGRLAEILPPDSRQVFWKNGITHELKTISLRDHFEVEPDVLGRLKSPPKARQKPIQGVEHIIIAEVSHANVGILKVDGKVHALLGAGVYGFWPFNRKISVEQVDTRLMNMEISGQEILTRDKVSLRVNMNATWHYTDVLCAYEKLDKPSGHLYGELQLGLRSAVGTRTLDEILENKTTIDEVVREYIDQKLTGFGLVVKSVGVKDIILPGEMKTILAKVVEAEKAAQANVIRRREETAATRSLLNTARVMEDNPTALRLKELETLERVAERIDKISVFGGLDQVLNGLVKITPSGEK